MHIEQIIRFDRYFVRKTGDSTGELLYTDKGNGEVYMVCCLGCRMGGRSQEEHVVDILAACRALDIKILTAGAQWETIIPSIQVTLVDVFGEQRLITEELEQARFDGFSESYAPKWFGEEDSERRISDYLRQRRSLYQACGILCPLGAG